MTEAEWLACDSSYAMLQFLEDKTSERKDYLTASAFLRRLWHLLPDERILRASEGMERYADGRASWDELRQAQKGAGQLWFQLYREDRMKGVLMGPRYLGRHAIADDAAGFDRTPERRRPYLPDFAFGVLPLHYPTDQYDYSGEPSPRRVPPRSLLDLPRSAREADDAALAQERAAQAELLREVFGNPFRPAAFDSSWLTPDVVALVRVVYDEPILPSGELNPARLAVLSDALEEAGCTDGAILSHLRSSGPHVRGCWALDLILGCG